LHNHHTQSISGNLKALTTPAACDLPQKESSYQLPKPEPVEPKLQGRTKQMTDAPELMHAQ